MNIEKVIRIIDELIFEAQKEPTWKTENALRCLKKELLEKQETVVRCKDCKYNDDGECIIKAGWFPVKPDWFCADGEEKWVM